MPETYRLKPIGQINSPFKEKFGLPRQPGLLTRVEAQIELFPPFNQPAAWQGIEGFSHLWLQCIFHHVTTEPKQLSVRPPRLGGNQKVGVFASRSPFRPNRLGLSVVELLRVEHADKRVKLVIACPDLCDGTPIVDIKPYLAYADSITDARAAYAAEPPQPSLHVQFSARFEQQTASWPATQRAQLKTLLEQSLCYDPRPAYKQTETSGRYGIKILDFDIAWQVENQIVTVLSLTRIHR